MKHAIGIIGAGNISSIYLENASRFKNTHVLAIADLNLYFAEQITDDGLSAVKGWKHLKRLNVRGTKVTDKTLEMLATVPTLESLDIGFAEITDVGLDHLSVLPNLRELTIGGNKLTDDGLQMT